MRNLLVTALALVGCLGTLAAADRPNIVFIFSDDHATQSISAYGGRLEKVAPTPNIDRLAKEGAVFRNSFCTNSICGPSRASILTGKHSHVNGFLNNNRAVFDSSQTTFPKLLQSAGYQTAIIGKWHLVSDPTGFDYWEILPGQGSYYNPDLIQMDGKRKHYEGYVTDVVTDLALDWLEEGRDAEKPFILMCQHKAPHRNWSPAPRHVTLFDDVTIPEPDTLFDDYANRSKTLAEQKMSLAKDFSWGHDSKFKGENRFPEVFTNIGNGEYRRMTPEQKANWDAAYEPKNQKFIAAMEAGEMDDKAITAWKYQRYIKDYLRCIRAVDENVGRVLDYLDESGLAENTIVIYSSDQGFYLGEHGWYDKRWMFEESLQMPFLIRWNDVVAPGSEPAALIQNIDYAPTFLEVAGAPIPATIHGKSLVPVLKNTAEIPEDWREAIYYHYYGENTHAVAPHDGVRTDRYKLMHFTETGEWNLFDLQDDPEEMRSVADETAYADVLESMKERYAALREAFNVSSATIPEHRLGDEWWEKRHKEKVAAAKQGSHDLVFIGDSITHGWEGKGQEVWDKYFAHRNALNLGFGGDRTEHVLWRLLHDEFDGQKPKVAVVMIGTNNTGHHMQAADETAGGVRQIIETIGDRSPETKVLLLGVFPRGAPPFEEHRRRNNEINALIEKFADGRTVHYLDLSGAFLEDDGTLPESIMPDRVHPNAEGYQIWAEAMEAKLAVLGGWEPVAP